MEAVDIAKSKTWPSPAVCELARAWFTGRRGLVIGGIAIVIAGLYMSWGWLAAIGAAPIILSLAPCAAMCALGGCAMMKGNSSCGQGTPSPAVSTPEATSSPRPLNEGGA